MHDTILLNKISNAIREVCTFNNIEKVNKLAVIVNHRSHVNEENLYEHLKYENGDRIGFWTKIHIRREDIEDQTAILQFIEGDKVGE